MPGPDHPVCTRPIGHARQRRPRCERRVALCDCPRGRGPRTRRASPHRARRQRELGATTESGDPIYGPRWRSPDGKQTSREEATTRFMHLADGRRHNEIEFDRGELRFKVHVAEEVRSRSRSRSTTTSGSSRVELKLCMRPMDVDRSRALAERLYHRQRDANGAPSWRAASSARTWRTGCATRCYAPAAGRPRAGPRADWCATGRPPSRRRLRCGRAGTRPRPAAIRHVLATLEVILLALPTAIRADEPGGRLRHAVARCPATAHGRLYRRWAGLHDRDRPAVVWAFNGIQVDTGSNELGAILTIIGGGLVLAFAVGVLTGRISWPPAGAHAHAGLARTQALLDHAVTVRTAALAGPATHLPGIFDLVALNLIVADDHRPRRPSSTSWPTTPSGSCSRSPHWRSALYDLRRQDRALWRWRGGPRSTRAPS